jgi:hypothetical protein
VADDVACLISILAPVAIVAVALFLAWMQSGKTSGASGSYHGDPNVDPYTGVPYGAMDDETDDW